MRGPEPTKRRHRRPRYVLLPMSHASPRMKRHAREMRRAPTTAERRVWSLLHRRFDGLKFKRQVPFGPYILDFYCAGLKLAIELDGKHHQRLDMVDSDTARSRYLAERGVHVLRIENEALIKDPRIAGEMIQWAILQRPPSAPSPLCGGEKA